MRYILMLLGAGAIAGLDQWTKAWTVQNIPLHGTVPVLDGVFHLTYLRNTGMAFSLLEGMRWLFLVVTAAFLVFAVLAVVKRWVDHPLGLTAVTMITGGAIGNLIDRLASGAVVDMIELDFLNFAVFNVADCFVTVGVILLLIWAVFFDKKKDAGRDAHDASL